MLKNFVLKTSNCIPRRLFSNHLYRTFCSELANPDKPLQSQNSDKKPLAELYDLGNEGRGDYLTEKEMYTYKEKNFMDHIRLHVYGGKGGLGSVTYEDTRSGLKGKSNGGSGGRGGGILIRADINEPDLSYIKSKVKIN